MEIYTGNDIIEIERIKKAIENESFIKKVYTENEIKYCENKQEPARTQSYAARFAAKEAIYKAISKIFPYDNQITWTTIEILKEETGRPYVNLKIKDTKKQKLKIDVSMSHIKEYATANAIAIYKE